MYKLTIEADAKKDLHRMIAEGGEAKAFAARIVTLLQEIGGSQVLLGELLTRKFANDQFNVDKFVELYDAGLNLWRIALYRLDVGVKHKAQIPYRVLYGYDQPCFTFRVLGILPRDFNYDPNHELCKRIVNSYHDLGLPTYGVLQRPTKRNTAH